MKKLLNCLLLALTLCIMNPAMIFASEFTEIREDTYLLKSAAGNCGMNLWDGRLQNKTRITAWSHNTSDQDQRFKIKRNGDAYKIYPWNSDSKVVDVYRWYGGSYHNLEADMKVDLWDNNDDVAQNVLFEKQSDNSFIIKMQSNPSLVLSLSGTGNGDQLKLAEYDPNNGNQRFFFIDLNGNVTDPVVYPSQPSPAPQPEAKPAPQPEAKPAPQPAPEYGYVSAIRNISEGVYAFRSAAGNCGINLWDGKTSNGTKVTAWTHNVKDIDQHFRIKRFGDKYKIYPWNSASKAVDVNRWRDGAIRGLEAGMVIDVWDANDDIAQFVVFEHQANNSFIIRMAENQSLVLSLSGTGNGDQLKLAQYNPDDDKQRFYFADMAGRLIVPIASAEEDQRAANGQQIDGNTKFYKGLEQVKLMYPNGGGYDDKVFSKSVYATQCHGFACYLLKFAYGTNNKPYPGLYKDEYEYIYSTPYDSKVNELQVGDLVRYRSKPECNHSFVVTDIRGDEIYYCEANFKKDTVTYDQHRSKSELDQLMKKRILDPPYDNGERHYYGWIARCKNK